MAQFLKVLAILAAISVIGILGKLVAPSKFRIDNVDITTTPDAYAQGFVPTISGNGFRLTLNFTIVKEFPLDTTLNISIFYRGVQTVNTMIVACSGFEDPVFCDNVVNAGYPKGVFPTSCPIEPNNCAIVDWEFPHYKLPPSSPPGEIKVNVDAFVPGNEPFFKLVGDGEIVNDGPFGK